MTLGVSPDHLPEVLAASEGANLAPLPEDLILHKVFAGRPRDLEDARSVVRRNGEELDWAYLLRWAHEFASIPGREQLPGEVERLREEGRDESR